MPTNLFRCDYIYADKHYITLVYAENVYEAVNKFNRVLPHVKAENVDFERLVEKETPQLIYSISDLIV